ncbi:MAG: PilZ domain-containing protein [Vicinamibacterales bacterium]
MEPRFPGSAVGMLRATMRPGRHVQVVDISPTGAQVETDRPLRPGTRVHVRLVSEGWSFAAAAVVLRCVVWTLRPDTGVIYRGGLRFEDRSGPLHLDLVQLTADS